MMNLTTIIPQCLTVVAATVAFSVASIASEPAPAAFQATDCWVAVEDKAVTECGWLTVPERWDRSGSRTLTLPVVIFRPRDPDPSLDPVIYLSGGPGYPALGPEGSGIAGWRRAANSLFPGRALILFDQRGSGLGSPRLDCPEGDDPRVWWQISSNLSEFGDVAATMRAATAACRERLVAAGHDLQAFTSRHSAADVDALRRALGLEQVVLFGISYGTRLALTVMRHYPETVSTAILDSVFPPQSMWPGEDGEALGGTLDRLFAACTAYERCAKAYPDLKVRFQASLADLAAEPVVLEIDNLEGREPLYARIDHRAYVEILRLELYHTSRTPGLPALIDAVAKGRYRHLRPHAENAIYGRFPRDYDLGMAFSIACRDKAGVTLRRSDVDGTGSHPYLSGYVDWIREPGVCLDWPIGEPDSGENAPVASAVPSLLLAGGLDGSTPVEWAEMAAKTLSNGHLFVFPAIAHVQVGNSPCAREILRTFLADPLSRPSPPCLGSLRRPAFLALGGG